MPFKKGQPRAPTAGRRKGTPNKRTTDLAAYLDSLIEKHGCPFDGLLKIAQNEEVEMPTRVRAYGEFLSYRHPKLRSVEVKGDGASSFTFRIIRGDEKGKGK